MTSTDDGGWMQNGRSACANPGRPRGIVSTTVSGPDGGIVVLIYRIRS
jgi:hypothetical protein